MNPNAAVDELWDMDRLRDWSVEPPEQTEDQATAEATYLPNLAASLARALLVAMT